jgi:hypothetical protein
MPQNLEYISVVGRGQSPGQPARSPGVDTKSWFAAGTGFNWCSFEDGAGDMALARVVDLVGDANSCLGVKTPSCGVDWTVGSCCGAFCSKNKVLSNGSIFAMGLPISLAWLEF